MGEKLSSNIRYIFTH